MEVMNRRQEPEDYYSTRDRRTSWDTMPEGDTDEYITSPKEQLLDLIKLYNYLQSQRDSGKNGGAVEQLKAAFHHINVSYK